MGLLESATSLFGGSKTSFKMIEIGFEGNILEADAMITETYAKTSSVTSYPVEEGNDIAEHALVNAFSISIAGINSNSSMSYFNMLNDIASSTLGQALGGTSQIQTVWDQLNNWLDLGTALKIKCIYENDGFDNPFVIETLNVARNKDIGNAIRYNLTLRQIALVQIGKTTRVNDKLSIFDTGVKQLGPASGEGSGKAAAVATQPTAAKIPTALRDGSSKTDAFSVFNKDVEYN